MSRRGEVFQYVGFDLEPGACRLVCHYELDGRSFSEEIRFPGRGDWDGGDWDEPAVAEAARIVFLLTGISYYKTAAPATIDLGPHALTVTERDFLRSYYLDGLGEFAYRNGLDLSDLRIQTPTRQQAEPAGYSPRPGRPLVPFGGGIDSITTVDLITAQTDDAALFVVNRP